MIRILSVSTARNASERYRLLKPLTMLTPSTSALIRSLALPMVVELKKRISFCSLSTTHLTGVLKRSVIKREMRSILSVISCVLTITAVSNFCGMVQTGYDIIAVQPENNMLFIEIDGNEALIIVDEFYDLG